VFHFRSIVLNVIVIAIRWYLGETSYGVTYLQMVWIQTSLVGWYIYREKSASGVPIIEPGDAVGVMIWGFIGDRFISALTSTIIDALVATGFNTNNFIKSFEFFGVSTALFFVFFGVGWLEHKLRGESGWITWISPMDASLPSSASLRVVYNSPLPCLSESVFFAIMMLPGTSDTRRSLRNLTKPALKHNNSSKACSYYFWA